MRSSGTTLRSTVEHSLVEELVGQLTDLMSEAPVLLHETIRSTPKCSKVSEAVRSRIAGSSTGPIQRRRKQGSRTDGVDLTRIHAHPRSGALPERDSRSSHPGGRDLPARSSGQASRNRLRVSLLQLDHSRELAVQRMT